MPRQKCDNARSLARPVAASRSLQREIMPSWQNCIVAARRFPRFLRFTRSFSLPPSSSGFLSVYLLFLGEGGEEGERGEGGEGGEDRTDYARMETGRQCRGWSRLFVNPWTGEEEGERFNPIRGNNSEKRVLKRFCRQVFTADGRLGVGRGKGIN